MRKGHARCGVTLLPQNCAPAKVTLLSQRNRALVKVTVPPRNCAPAGVFGGKTEVVPDEADDGVPDFPQGPVGVLGFRIIRRKVRFGGVGQPEVGAQHVDARLAHPAGGGIVGETGQGVHAAQAHGGRRPTELGDSGGEALGVQASVLAQGAVLVDALAPLGHHQGDQGAGSRDRAEGQLDQLVNPPRDRPSP